MFQTVYIHTDIHILNMKAKVKEKHSIHNYAIVTAQISFALNKELIQKIINKKNVNSQPVS